jgi:hypothetical protein
MLMVLVGIMICLIGRDAGADERFLEPKLLKWPRFGAASWWQG